ncbi:hypothetical protein E2C01_047527 [Portunus trituberculatus]|uniref:Uncharacterized protein n=1 Tax=Portunus trituberculatus TaxID=210409 RepID=A0A5B7G0V1_PORTR|nr:hypothetical protein [Portunus trituberculatus]
MSLAYHGWASRCRSSGNRECAAVPVPSQTPPLTEDFLPLIGRVIGGRCPTLHPGTFGVGGGERDWAVPVTVPLHPPPHRSHFHSRNLGNVLNAVSVFEKGHYGKNNVEPVTLVALISVGLADSSVVAATKVAHCIQTVLVTAGPVGWLEELFPVCNIISSSDSEDPRLRPVQDSEYTDPTDLTGSLRIS